MLFPTYNVRRQAFTGFFRYLGFFLPYVKGRQVKYKQQSTALKNRATTVACKSTNVLKLQGNEVEIWTHDLY